MTTPIGMNPASTLDTQGTVAALKRKAWNLGKIHQESLTNDPMTRNQGLIEPIVVESNKETVKVSSDKAIISITPKTFGGDKGVASVTMALVQSLEGAAINGNAQYIGEEEDIRSKSFTVWANDYARPLASFGYGIDQMDQEWVTGGGTARKLLSQWNGETKGLHLRQGYCENLSENLEANPVGLTKGINSNLAFADAAAAPADSGVVTYDSTLADYKEAIGDAAALTTAATNHLTVDRLVELGDVASQEKYLKPLAIGGKLCYVLYVSNEELRNMRGPGNTGSFGEYFLQAAGDAIANIKQVIPDAVMMVGNIIICSDDRAATLTIGGADGSWTTAFGYKLQGRGTSRGTASVGTKLVFNVNTLVGAESLVTYDREMVDYRTQDDDYGRNQGELVRACSGAMLPNFDLDTPTDTSIQNEGSMLILTARESSVGK